MQTDKIIHTLPPIDRCCKSSGWDTDLHEVKPDRTDHIKRLSCDISKKSFTQEYVNKRRFAILRNCTHNWKARKWTFKSKYILILLAMFLFRILLNLLMMSLKSSQFQNNS